MDHKLKIALIPMDSAWGDVDENLAAASRLLRRVKEGTDLVVLPEMFTTGFITEPTLLTTYTKELTDRVVEQIQQWARELRMAIAGSIIASDGTHAYNRGFIIEPGGDVTFYDKRHLFSVGGEARSYTPGDRQSPVVRYRGCNIKLLVCYDLRFPVWSRNVDNAYDLLIYPANWPDSRATAWQRLLCARAIENQAYVAGCNRTGSDDFGEYSKGRSYVFNDWGDDIAVTDAETGILYADVDLEAISRHRRKFPAYKDADTFYIDL